MPCELNQVVCPTELCRKYFDSNRLLVKRSVIKLNARHLFCTTSSCMLQLIRWYTQPQLKGPARLAKYLRGRNTAGLLVVCSHQLNHISLCFWYGWLQNLHKLVSICQHNPAGIYHWSCTKKRKEKCTLASCYLMVNSFGWSWWELRREQQSEIWSRPAMWTVKVNVS